MSSTDPLRAEEVREADESAATNLPGPQGLDQGQPVSPLATASGTEDALPSPTSPNRSAVVMQKNEEEGEQRLSLEQRSAPSADAVAISVASVPETGRETSDAASLFYGDQPREARSWWRCFAERGPILPSSRVTLVGGVVVNSVQQTERHRNTCSGTLRRLYSGVCLQTLRCCKVVGLGCRNLNKVSPVFWTLIAVVGVLSVLLVLTGFKVFAVLLVVICWVVSVILHEFGHASAAYFGGDTSVASKAYLTLNPLAYLHPFFSIVLPLIILCIGGVPLPGAAVHIEQSNLRSRRWRTFVSFAGPLASLFAGVLFALLYGLTGFLSGSSSPDIFKMLRPLYALMVWLNAFGFFFNLIPLPPFDGWGMLEPWLSYSCFLKKAMGNPTSSQAISWITVILLIVLFSRVPLINPLAYFITTALGVPKEAVAKGLEIFFGTLDGISILP